MEVIFLLKDHHLGHLISSIQLFCQKLCHTHALQKNEKNAKLAIYKLKMEQLLLKTFPI